MFRNFLLGVSLLLALVAANTLAAEKEFVIHPYDISDVSYARNGTVFVRFGPEKAKELSRLPTFVNNDIVVEIPHDGLSRVKIRFDAMLFEFKNYSDSVRFYKACRQGIRR